MITDLILTQAAALLATVQLNCTAPQIQVVDDRSPHRRIASRAKPAQKLIAQRSDIDVAANGTLTVTETISPLSALEPRTRSLSPLRVTLISQLQPVSSGMCATMPTSNPAHSASLEISALAISWSILASMC